MSAGVSVALSFIDVAPCASCASRAGSGSIAGVPPLQVWLQEDQVPQELHMTVFEGSVCRKVHSKLGQ